MDPTLPSSISSATQDTPPPWSTHSTDLHIRGHTEVTEREYERSRLWLEQGDILHPVPEKRSGEEVGYLTSSTPRRDVRDELLYLGVKRDEYTEDPECDDGGDDKERKCSKKSEENKFLSYLKVFGLNRLTGKTFFKDEFLHKENDDFSKV